MLNIHMGFGWNREATQGAEGKRNGEIFSMEE